MQPETQKKPVDSYVKLGRTGLKVSRISFGNWLNSDDQNQTERMVQLVKKAWDLGINFFDTAEMYGFGEAEKQFAAAFKQLNVPRDQYVLSTKVFFGPTRYTNPNDVGLSRKHIVEGLKNSLARLEHDYVDIVFAHRFDRHTPLEETCRAFDWVIKQGWANYWGTSEWTASEIFEAMMICEKYDLAKPVADQCQYNMLTRDKVEVDYQRLFDYYGYGTTVWSPLAGGILTGKYNDGFPEDSRIQNELFKNMPFIRMMKDKLPKVSEKLKQLGELSKRLECSQAQLAMAWVLKSNDVSTAITGCTKESQLEDTVKALQILDKLTPEVLEEIENILETRPDAGMDFRGNKAQTMPAPAKPRR